MATLTELKRQIGDTISRAWFKGEVVDCGGNEIPLELTTVITSPIEIRHSKTSSRLVWRRNLNHIARDDAHIYIIWLVLSGTMKITGPNGVHVLTPDSMAIMTFDVPFIVESENGKDDPLNALAINVPAHMIEPQLAPGRALGIPYAAASSDGRMAQTLFLALLRDGEGLGREMALRLATSAVQCVCNVIRAQQQATEKSKDGAPNIDDIAAFIAASISDPELSGEMISAQCGISRRQLHYLLKRNGMSLTDLIWKQRLRNVADWLRAPDMAQVPIAELAHAAGYKNYEHFSRAFKAMFGISPRRFRTAAQTG